jgi:AcrR family transcriptional regulator
MTSSKLEKSRQNGTHQVEAQAASILDAAETTFLRQGLENTTMVDIAAQAGITKVTLYRYFPNRDVIAVKIWERMMQKVMALFGPMDQLFSLEGVRNLAHVMIHNFETLRDAYRFIGMFDQFYLDHAPDTDVTQWTKQEFSLQWGDEVLSGNGFIASPEGRRCVVIMNTVIWFLEKVALRGEASWFELGVPLEEQLTIFEEMVTSYLERLLTPQ